MPPPPREANDDARGAEVHEATDGVDKEDVSMSEEPDEPESSSTISPNAA